jgi:hypothetical protein
VVKKIFISLFIADGIFLALSVYIGKGWILNSQIAFLSSSLVMLASMLSHARMVRARIETGEKLLEDRDLVDRIDDPHDLYAKDKPVEVSKNEKSLKETIREEKQKIKAAKRSPLEALRDSKASMSFYRLGAYALLIFGFVYLNNNHLLHPLPYLLGLGVPAVAIVSMLMRQGDGR